MSKNNRPRRQSRYSAKLLFQWRVVVDGDSGKRRRCEIRIVIVRASNARDAIKQATRRGRASQFRYSNSDGNPVFFEFVGILDLLKLGSECERDEVWYDVVELVQPMERKSKIIPPKAALNAVLNEPA